MELYSAPYLWLHSSERELRNNVTFKVVENLKFQKASSLNDEMNDFQVGVYAG